MGEGEFRQLSDVEKKIVLRQMEDLKEQREYESFLVHNADLMLNEGLWQNFKRQKRDFQVKKRMAAENVLNFERTIIILQQQLDKGVLRKEQENSEEGGK